MLGTLVGDKGLAKPLSHREEGSEAMGP